MLWLWKTFGPKKIAAPKRKAGAKPKVNILGPAYGIFNSPLGYGGLCRLVEGIGAEVNLCFPLGASGADLSCLLRRPTSASTCRIRGAAYRRRWNAPISTRLWSLESTTRFLRALGETLDLDPEPFIEREKHSTLKAIWDLWRSVTQDFFSTASFRSLPAESYAKGLKRFLEDGHRHALRFHSFVRSAGQKPDNAAVRDAIQKAPPMMLFGSINERMYAAEAGGRSHYIPRPSPAP